MSLSGGGGSGTNRGAAMLGNTNGNSSPMPQARRSTHTGAFNDGMAANGSGNTLTNNGTITTTGPNAYGMTAAWGQTNTGQLNNMLINTGTVSTVRQHGAGGVDPRRQRYHQQQRHAVNDGSPSNAAFLQGNNDQLINSGKIIVTGASSDAVFSNTVSSSFTATIQNLAGGQIISQNGTAIRTLNANTTIINAGLVQSNVGTAITMGNGNNSLVLQTGSNIIGTANGGGGSNTVTLQGTGTASNAFVNFQTLIMQGSAWTWAGSGTFTTALVQSGTLNVTGTLGASTAATVNAGATLEASPQNMPKTITDNGLVLFNQTADGTYAAAISGSGAIERIGNGVLTLTGNNIYTGGTTISAGTLQLGNGGASGSILGNVTDNGALVFNRSDTITFPGVISGHRQRQPDWHRDQILTGDNIYTGGTTISAGTLQLGNGLPAAASLAT